MEIVGRIVEIKVYRSIIPETSKISTIIIKTNENIKELRAAECKIIQ